MSGRKSGATGCVVLAAGAGRRFGGAKQLAPLAGRPLLEHALMTAAAVPFGRRVVVLGSRAGEIMERIDLHGVDPVVCDQWGEGMAASLREGVAALGEVAAAVILLGDQPLVSPAAVHRVLAARGDGDAVRATYDGRPGHPVLFGRSLFPAVAGLRGETGARHLLTGAEQVECADLADPLDVDSPADLRLAEHVLTA